MTTDHIIRKKSIFRNIYSLYNEQACNEFARPISMLLHKQVTQSVRKNVAAVGNIMSNLTGPRFES